METSLSPLQDQLKSLALAKRLVVTNTPYSLGLQFVESVFERLALTTIRSKVSSTVRQATINEFFILGTLIPALSLHLISLYNWFRLWSTTSFQIPRDHCTRGSCSSSHITNLFIHCFLSVPSGYEAFGSNGRKRLLFPIAS